MFLLYGTSSVFVGARPELVFHTMCYVPSTRVYAPAHANKPRAAASRTNRGWLSSANAE